MARIRNVTIKINEETKSALLALAGKLQLRTRKSITIDDAIRYLFSVSPDDAELIADKDTGADKSEGSRKKKE